MFGSCDPPPFDAGPPDGQPRFLGILGIEQQRPFPVGILVNGETGSQCLPPPRVPPPSRREGQIDAKPPITMLVDVIAIFPAIGLIELPWDNRIAETIASDLQPILFCKVFDFHKRFSGFLRCDLLHSVQYHVKLGFRALPSFDAVDQGKSGPLREAFSANFMLQVARRCR